MTTNSDIQKKAMVEALEANLGVVTKACSAVGIARSTHYEWYSKDEQYKSDVDAVAEIALDFAESMLHERIKDKDTTATIFYLKTKGKKRGYVEKTEMDLTSLGQQIQGFNYLPPNDNSNPVSPG